MKQLTTILRTPSLTRVWYLISICIPLILIWGYLLHELHQEYRDAIDGSGRETNALARGLSETTLTSFDIIDQTLKDMRESYVRDPEHFDLPSWFDAHRFGSELIIQASVVGPDGMVIQSNIPLTAPVNVSDREHIKFHKDSTVDEIFISRPILGRVSKKKSLNVTRKIVAADGSYAGTVVVSAGLDYLTRFIEALSTRGNVELIGSRDGIVRARAPVDNELIGNRNPNVDRMTAVDGGTIRIGHISDPTGQIVSYRRLQKYPLLVTVALDSDEVFEQYNKDRLRYYLSGAALSLMIVAVCAILLRQQARMLLSRSMLRATLENISQGILMVDANGEVPIINHRAVELLRLPPALMASKPSFKDILAYQLATNEFGEVEQDSPDFLHFVKAGGLAPAYSHYERVRHDGTALEIQTNPLPDGGAVRTYTDATERRRTEAAMADARDAAMAGVRARSEFMSVMSHEIRTPLNGILGIAEIMQGLSLDNVVKEYVNVISDSGAHLLQLINDVLDFSALDASRVSLENILFNLHETMQQTLALLSYQAAAKGLKMPLDIADDVPHMVMGDPQRLRQIILNLAGNGLKFTSAGFVRVTVTKVRDEGEDVRVTVSVTDTGIGIAADAREHLFDEFVQGDNSIRRRFGGSGLGLAITRRLVEMMDGHVTVESEPNVGSTFRFDLKLRCASLDLNERKTKSVPEPGPANLLSDAPIDASLRILLAEDNATNRLVATRMLEKLGHRVRSVTDGIQAVEAVRNDEFDIVLMDMMMPEMDGLTATRLIRLLPTGQANLPIVGLTANASAADEDACRGAGMDGFVTKPAKSAVLDAAIHDAMQMKQRGARFGSPQVTMSEG